MPIVGAAMAAVRDELTFAERMAREHGDIVHWMEFDSHVYQLNHPDDIEHVLVRNNQNYVKGQGFQRTLGPVLGNGILNSEGEEWRRNRRLIQPSFHPDRIQVYAGLMADLTATMLNDWEDGETRSIHQDMMDVTLRIVTEALFGVDIDQHADDIESAVNAFISATSSLSNYLLPDAIPLPSRKRMADARETLDRVVDDIIRRKQQEPGEYDVISMLLAARDSADVPLSDEQIRDEAITLITAGHETTAVSMTYTAFLLAQHPAVERQLIEELDSVLDGDRPTMTELQDLTYTEQVIRESMRLYPPVPRIVREATASDTISGYEVPAGSEIRMYQWIVHRDPQWYADPLAFEPSRWTTEFEQSLPRLAYFPFGAGPRRCIGDRFAMFEAKLLLAMIYQRYHLELVSERDLGVIPTVTSRPKEDVRMTVHERRDEDR